MAAITKKHSELSGSSLHNPKGIEVVQPSATGTVLKLDVDGNRILPAVDEQTDIGQLTTGEFRNIYISGDVYKHGDIYAGGSGISGIFSQQSRFYDNADGGTDYTQRWETTGSLNITGSLNVMGAISGAINVDNLQTDGNLQVGNTVTASAFYLSGENGGYILSASNDFPYSASLFMTGSSDNIYREFGNVGIGTNSPKSRLHIVGNVDIDGGDLLLDNSKYVRNAQYGEPIFVVASGSNRSVSLGLRGGSPSIGKYNVIIGDSAGETLSDVNSRGNTIIGFESVYKGTGIANSTILGYKAGYNLIEGDSNVLIGYEAGKNIFHGDSNKLIIANSDTDVPIIYGNFDSNRIGINTRTGSIEGINSRFSLVLGKDQNGTDGGGLYCYGQIQTEELLYIKSDISSSHQISSNYGFSQWTNRHTGLFFPTNDRVKINADNVNYINMDSTGLDLGEATTPTQISGSIVSIQSSENALVGIGTKTPTHKLTVIGNISASNHISSSGGIYTEGDAWLKNRVWLKDVRSSDGSGIVIKGGDVNITEGRMLKNGLEYITSENTGSFLTATGSNIFTGLSQTFVGTEDSSDSNHSKVAFKVSGSIDVSGEFLKNGSAFYVVDERGTILGEHTDFFTPISSSENTLLGFHAGDDLQAQTLGFARANVMVGDEAGQGAAYANKNVVIGGKAGYNLGNGNYNVLIGANVNGNSGSWSHGENRSNITGSIFIGHKAGYYSVEDNTLIIENSDSKQPLLYGHFATSSNGPKLGINVPTGSLRSTFTVSGSVSASGDIHLATHDNTAAGNKVLIGHTTAVSGYQLHSKGTLSTGWRQESTSDSNDVVISYKQPSYEWQTRVSSNQDFQIIDKTRNVNVLNIDKDTGKVGLNGITNPLTILHLSASGNDDGIRLDRVDGKKLVEIHQQDSDAANIRMYDGNDLKTQITSNPTSDNYFNGNELGTKVGIGEDSPTSALHISTSLSTPALHIVSKESQGILIETDEEAYSSGAQLKIVSGKNEDSHLASAIIELHEKDTNSRAAGVLINNGQDNHNWFMGRAYAGTNYGFSIGHSGEAGGYKNSGFDSSMHHHSASLHIGNDGRMGFAGKDGLYASTPTSSFEFKATDNLILPYGTTAQRGFGDDDTKINTGSVRFNTELIQFEGYDGNHWGSLGGVIDVDRDTYIKAESPLPNTDNDQLHFVIADSMMLEMSASRPENNDISKNSIKIAPNSASAFYGRELLHVSGGNVRIEPDNTDYYSFENPTERLGLKLVNGSTIVGGIGASYSENPKGLRFGVEDTDKSVNLFTGKGQGGEWDNSLNVWRKKITEVPGQEDLLLQVSSSGDTYVSRSLGIGIKATDEHQLNVNGNAKVDGKVDVTGIVTALEYHKTFTSSSIAYASGSNKLGDSPDDIHSFSGSIHTAFSSSDAFDIGSVEPINFMLGYKKGNNYGKVALGIGTEKPGRTIAGQYNAWNAGHSAILEVSGSHPAVIINSNKSGSLWFGNKDNTNPDHYMFRQTFKDGTLEFTQVNADGTSNKILNVSASGRVGIGTTNPISPLQVEGGDSVAIDDYILHNGDRDTKFGFNGANKFKVRTGGSDRVYVTDNGMGIGISDPQLSDGALSLEVAGDISTSKALRAVGDLEIYDGARRLKYDVSAGTLNHTGATLKINHGNGVDTEVDGGTLFVDASGNTVGLGTNSPSTTAGIVSDAAGHMVFSGYTESDYRLAWPTSGPDYSSNYISYRDWKTSATAGKNITNSTGNIRFSSHLSDYGLVISGSRVGIDFSKTADKHPTAALDVRQDGGTIPYIYISGSSSGHILDAKINNDQRFRIDNSGNIKFDVGSAIASIYNVGNGGLSLSSNSSNKTLHITHTDKIGIGTTAPTDELHISGATKPWLHLDGAGHADYNGAGIKLTARALSGSAGTDAPTHTKHTWHSFQQAFNIGAAAANNDPRISWQRRSLGPISGSEWQGQVYFYSDNAGHKWHYAKTNDGRLLTEATSSEMPTGMILSASTGNLGVGNTNPQERLHVQGNITASGAINLGGTVNTPTRLDEISLGMYQTSTNKGQLEVKNQEGYIRLGTKNTSFGHIETDNATFYFNRGIVTDGDMFGSYGSNDVTLKRDGTSGTADNLITIKNGETTFVNGTVEKLNLSSVGTKMAHNGTEKVAIGGVSPDEKLVIKTHANNYTLKIGDNEGGAQLAAGLNISGDTTMRIGTTANSSMLFYTNGNPRIRVDNSGKIGIGKTAVTPPEALTVEGNISASGAIIADQYIISSSTTYMTTSYSEGNTQFGDDLTDTHQFTGSLNVSASNFSITNGGKVGIGLHNPTKELDVVGGIKLSQDLYMGSNKKITWQNGDASITEGIGNSSYSLGFSTYNTAGDDAASNTPQLILDSQIDERGKMSYFYGNVSSSGFIHSEGNISASGNLVIDGGLIRSKASYMSMYSHGGAGLKVRTSGLIVSGNYSNGTTQFTNLDSGTPVASAYFGNSVGIAADTSGKLGVGTVTPDYKTEIMSNTGQQLKLSYDDSNGATFRVGSAGDLTIGADGGDIKLEERTDIEYNVTTGDVLDVHSSNITSGRCIDAHSDSTAWTTGNVITARINGNAGTGIKTGFNGEVLGTSDENRAAFLHADGGTKNYALLTNSGSVGFGDLAPTEALVVRGNISASGNLTLNPQGDSESTLYVHGPVTSSHIQFLPLDATNKIIGSTRKTTGRGYDVAIAGGVEVWSTGPGYSGGDVEIDGGWGKFKDGDVLLQTDATNGKEANVGIGSDCTTPTQKLEVNGNISSSGDFLNTRKITKSSENVIVFDSFYTSSVVTAGLHANGEEVGYGSGKYILEVTSGSGLYQQVYTSEVLVASRGEGEPLLTEYAVLNSYDAGWVRVGTEKSDDGKKVEMYISSSWNPIDIRFSRKMITRD